MIKTKICDIIGIEYPVIQGGMAWIADATLACAVSEGGGLGIISAVGGSDYLIEQIRAVKAKTDKPFGVNIMLKDENADNAAQIVIDEGVKVVTTGAGNPSKYMESWLRAGICVIPVVASTAAAKLSERAGVAAVIAEGGESGGHVGDLSTMTLTPQICDAVKIPVIAAGGIADGRGLAAALMLGAGGVQCGTVFLTAKECTVNPVYKEKVLKAKDIDTIVTGKRLMHPVRSLKTSFSRLLYSMEYDSNVTDSELEEMCAGSLRRAAKEGDEKNGCFMCGQCASMIKEEKSVKQIMERMLSEAEKLLCGGVSHIR